MWAWARQLWTAGDTCVDGDSQPSPFSCEGWGLHRARRKALLLVCVGVWHSQHCGANPDPIWLVAHI